MPKSFYDYYETRELESIAKSFVESGIDTKEFADGVMHICTSPTLKKENREYMNEPDFLEYAMSETFGRLMGGVGRMFGAGAKRVGQDIGNVAADASRPFVQGAQYAGQKIGQAASAAGQKVGQAANAVGQYARDTAQQAGAEIGQRVQGAQHSYRVGYVKSAVNDLQRLQNNLNKIGFNTNKINNAFAYIQKQIENAK